MAATRDRSRALVDVLRHSLGVGPDEVRRVEISLFNDPEGQVVGVVKYAS